MNLRIGRKKGAAFLEIMVVVALVLVGVAIVASGFQEIKKRARDSKRVSDIGQIQKALNLYNVGAGKFPVLTTEIEINGSDSFSELIRNEFTGGKIPTDPLYPKYSYTYTSNSDGSNYRIKFCLETDSIPEHKKGCDNAVSP